MRSRWRRRNRFRSSLPWGRPETDFARRFTIIAALAVFVGLPLLIYALGDTPRRSVLKESISLLTLLALFDDARPVLSRAQQRRIVESVRAAADPDRSQGHRLHGSWRDPAPPLPGRATAPFRSGGKAMGCLRHDAERFRSPGNPARSRRLVSAAGAERDRVFPKATDQAGSHRYRGWRHFHGAMAVTFTVLALWHAVELGRHTGVAMSALIIALAFIGIAIAGQAVAGRATNRPRTRAAAHSSSAAQPRPAQSATSSSAST